MKNKYLLSLIMLVFSLASANAADNVKVIANSEFSTTNPTKTIDVTIAETSLIGTNALHENDILHCNVIKITGPKRGKRAASFVVAPVSFSSEGVTKKISGNYYGKYAEKVLNKERLKNIDAKKVGTKAAISVGNHFVKGVAPAVALAEGMIKNEDGNRLESGVKQVYKSSPLSYADKGQNVVIKPGDNFYLVFKPATSSNVSDAETEFETDSEETVTDSEN